MLSGSGLVKSKIKLTTSILRKRIQLLKVKMRFDNANAVIVVHESRKNCVRTYITIRNTDLLSYRVRWFNVDISRRVSVD